MNKAQIEMLAALDSVESIIKNCSDLTLSELQIQQIYIELLRKEKIRGRVITKELNERLMEEARLLRGDNFVLIRS